MSYQNLVLVEDESLSGLRKSYAVSGGWENETS